MKWRCALATLDAAELLPLALALTMCSGIAHAQESYPSRPIRLIATTAVGAAGDAVARAVADGLAASMRHAIIVENMPAANGGLAAGQVAPAAPDGYTLLVLVDSTLTINPYLYRDRTCTHLIGAGLRGE
ncbi:MAG: tripartite tricarboxylate transporter substrate-binding protein [Xanthobacteraceae bacterium]